MTRKRGKKALYEVIGSSTAKYGYRDKLTKLKPEEQSQEQQGSRATVSHVASQNAALWPQKPPALRIVAGRVEISLSLPILVTVILAIVAAVLLFYNFGYRIQRIEPVANPQNSEVTEPAAQAETEITDKSVSNVETQPAVAEAETVETEPFENVFEASSVSNITEATGESSGSNRIVIASCEIKRDLDPVREYFKQYGIETQVMQMSGLFYLLTEQMYDNPNKRGTDGYEALQTIKEIGSGYVAPDGYNSFGAKPFHDAFGMKFDN